MRGFFLIHYANEIPRHLTQLIKLYLEGQLKLTVDNGDKLPNGPFVGLDKVVDAVEYMYSKKSIGKKLRQQKSNTESNTDLYDKHLHYNVLTAVKMVGFINN
ncbi:Prostaglandin reductase 3 [Bulinus truncatus]|nr:Prostaglandin reductase 3 [Bulinus truncatus]